MIARSVKECGLPPGVFALLFGAGAETGAALVDHPKVKAVGFTGSLSAGKALMQRAAARPEPIPCFMEMSSVNPVFVLPEALVYARRADRRAGFSARSRLAWASSAPSRDWCFCRAARAPTSLIDELKAQVGKAAISPMLTAGILKSYRSGVAARQTHGCVETVAQAEPARGESATAVPVAFQISGADLLRDPELATEVFGPSTLIIRYERPRGVDGAGAGTRRPTYRNIARHRGRHCRVRAI